MEKHIRILGIIYIALGAIGILAALLLFIIVAGGGLLSGDRQAVAITTTTGTVVALFLLLISIPGVIGGIGLLQHRRWARPLLIVIGALNLFSFPFGTAVGIYTLWALLKPETRECNCSRVWGIKKGQDRFAHQLDQHLKYATAL
jgi:hypothetical protein